MADLVPRLLSEDNGFERSSLKSKSKDNVRDVLCRNVTIYGKCRYEDKGCAYSHKIEPMMPSIAVNGDESLEIQHKQTLSADSPSFTPSKPVFLSPEDKRTPKPRSIPISPKSGAAVPFLPVHVIPRSINATTPTRHETHTPDWISSGIQEFIPGRLDPSALAHDSNQALPSPFDSFAPTHHQANPYLEGNLSGNGYFPQQHTFQQPAQYHQYAPIGIQPVILSNQRTVHDFFIPNELREHMQKQMAASLQTLPNSQLPPRIDNYHSLVPLDTTHHKSSSVFGSYHSWIYKVQSSVDARYYALRRIEGFRLSSEQPVKSALAWKNVQCANVVKIVDIFTNRGFGDSSLFVVAEFHPLSKTLAQHHGIGSSHRARGRSSIDQIPEQVLWSYLAQIASALKIIHNSGLAARVLDTSKIIVTDKNRIRLSGCAVMDVIAFDEKTALSQLQRQDLVKTGLIILSLGTNVPDASHNFARAMDHFKRFYKPDIQNAVIWLYSAQQYTDRNIEQFLTMIAPKLVSSLDAAFQAEDHMHHELAREVENGRLVRLLTKLNFVNERPEYQGDRQWSENGERFFLKLFRDYVFHQVDSHGQPVVDLAHVVSCMNKLDAGVEEKITLVSRDEQNRFIVSYKELRRVIESTFSDLNKAGRRS